MYYNFLEQYVYEAVQMIEQENLPGVELVEIAFPAIESALRKLETDTVFHHEKFGKQFLISRDWQRR